MIVENLVTYTDLINMSDKATELGHKLHGASMWLEDAIEWWAALNDSNVWNAQEHAHEYEQMIENFVEAGDKFIVMMGDVDELYNELFDNLLDVED